MTEREAFKWGFLLRCAEEGLDEAATTGRVKAASTWGEEIYGMAKNLLGQTGSTLGQVGMAAIPLSFLAPMTAGAAAGYVGGRLTDPGYDDKDVKRQELIAAYQAAADDMDDDLATRKELGR